MEISTNHLLTLNTDDPIESPSGTSASNGRLRKAGSLSLRSRRLTYTVVLAEERSGGVPPEGGRTAIRILAYYQTEYALLRSL